MMFILKVEACRARLFKMACLDLEVNETPKPTAAWKESCIKAIIPQVTTQCIEPDKCKASVS